MHESAVTDDHNFIVAIGWYTRCKPISFIVFESSIEVYIFVHHHGWVAMPVIWSTSINVSDTSGMKDPSASSNFKGKGRGPVEAQH
jgi:hypothetical protein